MAPPGQRPAAETPSHFGIHFVVTLEAENPLGLGIKTPNNPNPYNLTVMSKLAMKIWDVFSLPQTGTLSKIDPHAKPF